MAVERDIGRLAMVYVETHVPCFRRVACGGAEMTFIELRDTFAVWCGCDLSPVRSKLPHAYGVTSSGIDACAVCVDVMVASALLHAIVRHESRQSARDKCVVGLSIRASLVDIRRGHVGFFNPFDVNYVLSAALYEHARGLRAVATAWLMRIEMGGVQLQLVAARRIGHALSGSAMLTRAMARCYMPGGRVACALNESFSRRIAIPISVDM